MLNVNQLYSVISKSNLSDFLPASMDAQIRRTLQMANDVSTTASKAIFSRLVEVKNSIGKGISSVSDFFLNSNYDMPSKAAIALGILLAISRVTRAICETAVNPAMIAVHFPTFIALASLMVYHYQQNA